MFNWYVVFDNSENLTWERNFTRKGFEHCFCFAWSLSGTAVINYDGSFLEFKELPHSADELALAFCQEGKEVLKVSFLKKDKRKIFRGFTYCVSIVKSCLDLRNCWAVTPYGLYRWLLSPKRKAEGIEVVHINKIKKG